MSYNVLIVDDSEIIRAVVKKSIAMSGLSIGELHEASNGSEALQKLSSSWIDIVFTDINMPQMTGIELVEKMAQDEMLAKIPVVIISTERSETRINDLLQLGVRAYLKKPFRPEEFRRTVSAILDKPGG